MFLLALRIITAIYIRGIYTGSVLINYVEGTIALVIALLVSLVVRFLFTKKHSRFIQGILPIVFVLTAFVTYYEFIPSINRWVLPQLTPWRVFESVDGKFNVLFQSKPMEGQANEDSRFGKVTGSTFLSSVGNLFYSVIFRDYPDSVFQNQSTEEFMLELEQIAVKNLGGKLVSETEVLVDGKYMAKEFYVESTTNNPHARVRIFIVGHRVYQISVASHEKMLFSDNAENFFRSFHLKE